MTARSTYVVALCEGRTCVPFMDWRNEPLTETDAVARVTAIAARLRELKTYGRLVLLDRQGRRVAVRRVWP